MLELIAFDADDTLWHSEILYLRAQGKLASLLSSYADEKQVEKQLLTTEEANIALYGYGIKSCILSMIETAISLSGGDITAAEINRIIDFGREMLTAETRLLEHARDTVAQLARSHRLMIITKGDLLDQHAKLARSGIAHHFDDIEVVSTKDPARYRAVLARVGIRPEQFLMVGNSLMSDVLPVLSLGAYAVYIPYHITWAHEQAADELPVGDRFHQLDHLGQLPGLIEQLTERSIDLAQRRLTGIGEGPIPSPNTDAI